MPTRKVVELNSRALQSPPQSDIARALWEVRYIELFETMRIGEDAFSFLDVPKQHRTPAVLSAFGNTSPLAALALMADASRSKRHPFHIVIRRLVSEGAISEQMFWSMGARWLSQNHSIDELAATALNRLKQSLSAQFDVPTETNMEAFVSKLHQTGFSLTPQAALGIVQHLAQNPALCSRFVSEAARQHGCPYTALGAMFVSLQNAHTSPINADLTSLPLPFITTLKQVLDGDWLPALISHNPAQLTSFEHPSLFERRPMTREEAIRVAANFENGVIASDMMVDHVVNQTTQEGVTISRAGLTACRFLSRASTHHFLSTAVSHSTYDFLHEFMSSSTDEEKSHFAAIVAKGLLRLKTENESSTGRRLLAANILDGAAVLSTLASKEVGSTVFFHDDRIANLPVAHKQLLHEMKLVGTLESAGLVSCKVSKEGVSAFRSASIHVLKHLFENFEKVADLTVLDIRRSEQVAWFSKHIDNSKLAAPVKRWIVRGAIAGMSF